MAPGGSGAGAPLAGQGRKHPPLLRHANGRAAAAIRSLLQRREAHPLLDAKASGEQPAGAVGVRVGADAAHVPEPAGARDAMSNPFARWAWILWRAVRNFSADHGAHHAAGAAYFSLLSFPPLILFAGRVVAALLPREVAGDQVIAAIA